MLDIQRPNGSQPQGPKPGQQPQKPSGFFGATGKVAGDLLLYAAEGGSDLAKRGCAGVIAALTIVLGYIFVTTTNWLPREAKLYSGRVVHVSVSSSDYIAYALVSLCLLVMLWLALKLWKSGTFKDNEAKVAKMSQAIVAPKAEEKTEKAEEPKALLEMSVDPPKF